MMKRSQIYFPAEQWRMLNALSRQLHQSVSELIRQAVNRVYQQKNLLNFDQILEETAGLWKNRADLPPAVIYTRRLRRGRRLERLRRPRHA